MIKSWQYFSNCSYGKQTPIPFYLIGGGGGGGWGSMALKETVNENYF